MTAFWTNSCSSGTIGPQLLQEDWLIAVNLLNLAVKLQENH